MDKAGIQSGVEFVFREPPRPGAPIQRVRILEHVRGRKWKVDGSSRIPGGVPADGIAGNRLISASP